MAPRLPSPPKIRPLSATAGGAGLSLGGSAVLPLALAISFLVHAVVLAVQFRFPDIEKSLKKDSGLEVVLVNARHARAPDKPEALAQANLDGGGNTDAEVTASTPLPPSPQSKSGDQLVEAKKRVERLEAMQRKLLAETTERVAKTAPKSSETPAPAPREISGADLADSAAAIARMEAKIDKQLNEYARRPRKKFIGARTKEYRFARYVEDWRHKIERVGTLNYPASARGKLYGSMLMSVVIRADGTVERIHIHRSSGHKVLDEAAHQRGRGAHRVVTASRR